MTADEPMSTPDSAADATVGEREGRICEHDGCCNYRLCAHPKCCGYYVQSPATPPADDANRARVSGGLDGGERCTCWDPDCPTHFLPDDASDGQANTCDHGSATGIDTTPIGDPSKVWRCDHCGLRWSEAGYRSTEAERACGICENHARVEALIQRSSLGSTEATKVRESVPADIGIAITTAARHLSRAKAAEAERDTARREAGERIAVKAVWLVHAARGRSVDRVCASLEVGKSVCDDLLEQLGGKVATIDDWANHNVPEAPERWVRYVRRNKGEVIEQVVAEQVVDTSGTWFREARS